ncbi:MAG: VTT domain-containing protein [Bacteroidales bacterium]|nr:VTT domain-containing protein [Bacteroidales bacterium]
MENKKTKNLRVIIILITSLIAITIIVTTIGRDLYHGSEQSVLSFAIVHFSGYLFFLLMPVEIAFVYCVNNQDSIIPIILIALGTAISAQIIDYFIGYFVSSKFLSKYIGDRKSERAKKYIEKYGSWTIFVFNLLPLSSPIICLASGMLKYRLRDVVLYSTAGLLIKYSVIAIVLIYR